MYIYVYIFFSIRRNGADLEIDLYAYQFAIFAIYPLYVYDNISHDYIYTIYNLLVYGHEIVI